MFHPSEPTNVRVYEAATEAAALELAAADAEPMARLGWVVAKRRWSGPTPSANSAPGRRGAVAIVAAALAALALAAVAVGTTVLGNGWIQQPAALLAVALSAAAMLGVSLLVRNSRRAPESGYLWVVWQESLPSAQPAPLLAESASLVAPASRSAAPASRSAAPASRFAQRERGEGKLNPGGYCRRCGVPREIGAVACTNCGMAVSRVRSGAAR